MRKFIILFVLAFSFMSFASSNEVNSDTSLEAFEPCCTATVEYLGEPVASFTNCGIDLTLACHTARSRANNYIRLMKALEDFMAGF